MLLRTDAATEKRVGSYSAPERHMLPDAACTIAVIPVSARVPLVVMSAEPIGSMSL